MNNAPLLTDWFHGITKKGRCQILLYEFWKKGENSEKQEAISMDKTWFKALAAEDRAKYEAAEELGLLEKVQQVGWKNLTAKESGKIGGYLAAKRKKEEKSKKPIDK